MILAKKVTFEIASKNKDKTHTGSGKGPCRSSAAVAREVRLQTMFSGSRCPERSERLKRATLCRRLLLKHSNEMVSYLISILHEVELQQRCD